MSHFVTLKSRCQRGYNLVELAILITVVALLAGASLVPLGWKWEADTYRAEEQAMQAHEDALLGYALTHETEIRTAQILTLTSTASDLPAGRPYLPCPDIDGDGYEDRIDSVNGFYVEDQVLTVGLTTGNGLEEKGACWQTRGVLPWKTLGVPPADSWGNRYTYQVDDLFADAVVGFNQDNIPNNVEPRALAVQIDSSANAALLIAFADITVTATVGPFVDPSYLVYSTVSVVQGLIFIFEQRIPVSVNVSAPPGVVVPPGASVTLTTFLQFSAPQFIPEPSTLYEGNYVYQSRGFVSDLSTSASPRRVDKIPRLVCSVENSVYDPLCNTNLRVTRTDAPNLDRDNYFETAPLNTAVEGPVYVIVSHGKNGHGAVNHWRSALNSVVCNPPVDSAIVNPTLPLDLDPTLSPHVDEINNYPFMWHSQVVVDPGYCRFITYSGATNPYVPTHFTTAPRRNVQSAGNYFDDVLVWSMRQRLFQHLVAAGKLPARALPIFHAP